MGRRATVNRRFKHQAPTWIGSGRLVREHAHLSLFLEGTQLYSDPRGWLQITPHIVHIHGKFYEFDEEGNAAAVRYPELIGMLK